MKSKQMAISFVLSLLMLLGSFLTGCKPSPSSGQANSPGRGEIAWPTDYDAALKEAQASHKTVVIHFFATWCGPCKLMERDTLSDEKVQQRLAQFVKLKIDVDEQPKIAAKYDVQAIPTMLVADANGNPVARTVGYLDAGRCLDFLDKAKPAVQKQTP